MGTTEDVIRRYYRAFNAQDPSAYDELFTDDCLLEAPGGLTAKGVDGMRDFDSVWWVATPDFHVDLTTVVADGDVVMIENHIVGTHTGVLHTPGGDLPPSGRTLDGKYAGVFEVVDGRIASTRFYYDQVEILTQLGFMPTS